MKKSNWMSEAGHESGKRAERLHQQALRARSPMEVFAEEFVLVVCAILIAGAVLGAVTLGDTIPQSFEPGLGGPLFWVANRLVALVAGALGAFLTIDVPLTAVVLWLRRYRPALFQPRR
jgi:hypothetical protein